MSDVIGFGTAFQNPDNGGAWESGESVDIISEDEALAIVRKVMKFYDFTEEDFNANEPLFLTEIRTVRQITWEDVAP